MEALIVISIIGVVIFLAIRAKKKDNKDREVPVKPPIVVEPEEKPVEPIPIEPKPVSKIYYIELPKDGSDVTTLIQSQINSIPDGVDNLPNIIQFPDGVYWTEGFNISRENKGIISFYKRNNLIVRGEKTILYTKRPGLDHQGSVQGNDYSHRRHVWIQNSTHIEITLTIEGSNKVIGSKVDREPDFTPDWWIYGEDNGAFGDAPAYKEYLEFEHAFASENSHYITFNNCNVNGVFGDGICIGGDVKTGGSSNIKVLGGNITNTGRQQVAIYNSRYVLIDGLVTSRGRRSIFDLENYSDDGFIEFVEIRNTNTYATHTFIAALGRGIVNNINIQNNKFRTPGRTLVCQGRSGIRRSNWKFTDNARVDYGFGSPISSIGFGMTDNILIENNFEPIAGSQSRSPASFTDCKNVKIKGNDFKYGIYIKSDNYEVTASNNNPVQQIVIQ